MRFVALDTETTGVNPQQDRIIDLCMREVTWPLLLPLDGTSIRVNPGIPIPPEATKIHSLTDKDVASCPSFQEVAPLVQEFLRDAVLIAYNGRRFDVPLLHRELVRAGCNGLPIDTVVIDPYETFMLDVPHSLAGALKHYTGEDHWAAHCVESDVEAMLKVLGNQLLLHPAPDLLAAARNPDRRPLDHTGHFYVDPGGITRFGFGKHRGKPIAAFPDYLKWILRTGFGPEVEAVARKALSTPAAA